MSNTDLLPCPFCGRMVIKTLSDDLFVWHKCDWCHAEGPAEMPDAAPPQGWNHRARGEAPAADIPERVWLDSAGRVLRTPPERAWEVNEYIRADLTQTQAVAVEVKPVAWAESYDGVHFHDGVSVVPTKYHTIPLYTHPAPAPVQRLSQAALDVLAERQRQIKVEGWTAEHDAGHFDGAIARAAASYALASAGFSPLGADVWPWSREWWKPTDPRRNLVKAGALIQAEIERLDRAALTAMEGR